MSVQSTNWVTLTKEKEIDANLYGKSMEPNNNGLNIQCCSPFRAVIQNIP